MTSNLFGQYELILATEGTALPSDTEVATFTDGTANDTAANFTATINWGDGVTTVGTVVGSNGSFTVESGHTYSEAGSLNAVITVTRNTDGAQIVLPGVVYVDDVNNLSGNSAGTIVGAPNQALSNVVVATFNDSYTGQGTNGFTVNIDWGDGTTTAGTLSLGGNQIYTVTGSHTYATAGEFTITTFMNDNVPDSTVGFATTTADIGFGGNVVITSATETVAIPSGTAVATFADGSNDPASDYTATIIWGDGNTQVGSVSGSAGSYTVTSTANETYAVEGNYALTVEITNTADNASTTLAGTVGVAGDASLSASAITVTGNPNVALTNVAVATFSDGNTANTAGEFTALINWGDGTTSTGTVAGSGGSFTVIGSHTYAQNGDYPITVGMAENSDGGLGTDYATVQSTALIGLASISGASITTTEGTPVAAGTQVGVFSDSNLSDTAASFTATINWGDGTSSAGTVSGSNGSFTVTAGPHTYTNYGYDAVTATLTRTTDGSTTTAFGSATIADANSLSLTADNLSGNAGQALTNVQVATFSDTYTGSTASDFEAIINWGDGTTTAGTVSGSGGAFTVDGSHTYADGGNFDVTVTAFDEPPGTAIATGTAAASINLATQMVLTSATEGTALPNTTPVATFSDGNLSDTASDFTASISWGDGTTSTGTVVGSNGSFTVEGGHTYTNYGSDYASVTLTNTATQSTASVSGSVTVADANNLTGQSITFSTPINFSGAVATFTDTYTGTPASEFNATIAWGDGFTSAGTVTGSNGSYTVSGSHNYEDGGQYTVTVQGADNAPGTATFSVNSTADVSFAGQLVLNSATEGTALPGTTAVATFSDFNPTDTASDFTATINWGDGVTTTGTVVGAPGTFTVEGGHTYANYGNDTASVTVTDTLDQIQGTFSGTVAVADANVLTGHGTTITANKGQAFTGTVATFTDTYTATPASEFLATINWGDGTTSTGTISGANGSFTVSGTHSYVDGGEYTVTVQGEDDPPGTATFSATSTAKVSLPSSFVGQNLSNYDFANQNLAGADFAGSNLSDADFANADLAGANLQGANMQGADLAGANLTNAVVTGVNLQNADLAGADLQGANLQGDNLQGAALQNANLQGVNLQGANLQGDNLLGADLQGADLQGANLQGDDLAGDNLVGADLQGANLQNADLQNADLQNANLTGANLQGANLQGANLQGAQGAGNADPPSTGPDSNIVLQDAPGTPVIWFMNGTSVTGDVVSFMNGTGGTSEVTSLPAPPSSWQLITTGDFAGNGNADLLWQNADGQVAIWMMNGTSIASAVAIATPPSSWHIVDTADFTGNGESDILWQNSDGTPGIWIMNGTSIVSAVALPDPGSSWTVVGTGDFFGNDMADILLQNSNGTPMIWEMNGTSIVAEVTLPTPPSSWQIIGTGDFGNGQSDILWQNTDGQVAIWMMNGTSVASAVALTTPPSSWHFVGTADFTGNGIDDILWQNSDGTPGVWIMNGTTIVSAITLPNPNADPPASTAQASGAVVSPPPAVNGSPPAGQQGTGNGTWPGAFGSQWASSAPLWQGSGASGFGGGCSSSLLSGPTGASAPPLALRHG